MVPDTMISRGAEEKTYVDDLDAHAKLFNLPSMSDLVLGDKAPGRSQSDNDKSINFEDLIEMEPADGVDFHTSYEDTPKAKAKVKVKMRKGKKKGGKNSSQSEIKSSDVNPKKRRSSTRKKGETIRSSTKGTVDSSTPSRSFSSSPPLSDFVKAPKPLTPRRTKSLHHSFSVISSFLPKVSQFSNTEIDKFHSLNSSFTALSTTNHDETFTRGIRRTKSMHQSFSTTSTEPSDWSSVKGSSFRPVTGSIYQPMATNSFQTIQTAPTSSSPPPQQTANGDPQSLISTHNLSTTISREVKEPTRSDEDFVPPLNDKFKDPSESRNNITSPKGSKHRVQTLDTASSARSNHSSASEFDTLQPLRSSFTHSSSKNFQRLHNSFTVLPNESGEFVATSMTAQPRSGARGVTKKTSSRRAGAIEIRRTAPSRSKSLTENAAFSLSRSLAELSMDDIQFLSTQKRPMKAKSERALKISPRQSSEVNSLFSVVKPTPVKPMEDSSQADSSKGSQKWGEVHSQRKPRAKSEPHIVPLSSVEVEEGQESTPSLSPPTPHDTSQSTLALELLAIAVTQTPCKVSKRAVPRRQRSFSGDLFTTLSPSLSRQKQQPQRQLDALITKDRKKYELRSRSGASVKSSTSAPTLVEANQTPSTPVPVSPRRVQSLPKPKRRSSARRRSIIRRQYQSAIAQVRSIESSATEGTPKSPKRKRTSRRANLHASDSRIDLQLRDWLQSPSVQSHDPRNKQRPSMEEKRKPRTSLEKKLTRSPIGNRDRRRLNLPSLGTGSRILDDNISICPSESVPLASLATVSRKSDQSVEKRLTSKSSFLETLELVGKWKRKAKKEDQHGMEGLTIERLESRENSKKSARRRSSTKDSNPKEKAERHRSKSRGKTENDRSRSKDKNQKHHSKSRERSSSRRKESSSPRQRKGKSRISSKNSLIDAVEAKEARLNGYMEKTPHKERKKLDLYWIEAFKRNYQRRSLTDGDSASLTSKSK